MSTWQPSEGLTRAEMLVQILEVEARAAGSVITPVFRHRMVEMIAKTLDGGVVGTLTVTPAQVQSWTTPVPPSQYVFKNGSHPEDTVDDEAVHAQQVDQFNAYMDSKPKRTAEERAALEAMSAPEKPAKIAKGKPGKKPGKRGRPSKAEIEARKAAQE